MREDLTEVIFVLDRSGSMGSCVEGTIEGFNSFLTEKEGMAGEVRVSLYQFDNVHDTLYEYKNIDDAPLLTHETFIPRGATALYDAIGRTINRVKERISNMQEENSPSRVIFVIITDGHENASSEFTNETIKTLIEQQTKDDNWLFTYLGANQDAVLASSDMGISFGNTANYSSNNIGTRAAFDAVNTGIVRCCNMDSKITCDSFYDGDIKEGTSVNG